MSGNMQYARKAHYTQSKVHHTQRGLARAREQAVSL
jgi:hypothetical protein